MNEIEHPEYGAGEIISLYPDGYVLARFSNLPGGKYSPDGKSGPVIMAVVYAGEAVG